MVSEILSGVSNMNIAHNLKRQQKGQSLASFLVVAVFVLIPAFIGLTYLAKTGELRHRSYEAARYSAWEKTAWPANGGGHAKSDQTLAWESRHRVMGKADRVIDSKNDGKSAASASMGRLDPILYSSYLAKPGNQALADKANQSQSGLNVNTGEIKASLGGVLGGSVMKAVVKGLALDTTGYRRAQVSVPLAKADQDWLPMKQVSINSRYVLLDNAWNAANPSQARKRIKRAVLTDKLDNSATNTARNLVGSIFPEINSSNLEFGKVDVEVSPCQRLSPYGGSTTPSACR